MSTILYIGVNLIIIFVKRVKHTKEFKNQCSRPYCAMVWNGKILKKENHFVFKFTIEIIRTNILIIACKISKLEFI